MSEWALNLQDISQSEVFSIQTSGSCIIPITVLEKSLVTVLRRRILPNYGQTQVSRMHILCRHSNQMKSLETASTKLGADIRMEMVQMMLKTLNATRQSRSITAAANFHCSATLSFSSCPRNLSATKRTSSKIA